MFSRRVAVNLYFKEKRQRKLKKLRETIGRQQWEQKMCEIRHSALDFPEAFAKYYPLIREPRSAKFLFLDQNGVKQITPEIFSLIDRLQAT